jgi:predicted transcriptional regulator
MDAIQDLLVMKYKEIENRITYVLDQLNDEQVNWRPNESSNSVANLIVHIGGNINERISKGINNENVTRDRDQEFEVQYKSVRELKNLIHVNFTELIETAKNMNEEELNKTQMIRNRARTNLEVLLQCATHFSEHMGQIFYIAKMILDTEYKTTSIPKNE